MGNKEIKILLMRKGIKQADIARKLDVTKTAVHNVIKGLSESYRIKEAIALELGLNVCDLWPESLSEVHAGDDDVLLASRMAGLNMEPFTR